VREKPAAALKLTCPTETHVTDTQNLRQFVKVAWTQPQVRPIENVLPILNSWVGKIKQNFQIFIVIYHIVKQFFQAAASKKTWTREEQILIQWLHHRLRCANSIAREMIFANFSFLVRALLPVGSSISRLEQLAPPIGSLDQSFVQVFHKLLK